MSWSDHSPQSISPKDVYRQHGDQARKVSALSYQAISSSASNWLPKVMAVAALLGIIIGSLMRLRPEPYTQREVMYASILSQWLNSCLRCVFVPLLISNVFLTLSQLNFKTCIRISRRAFLFFLCSNISGVCVGIVMGLAFQPGISARRDTFLPSKSNVTIAENLMYSVINTVTTNVLQACLFQSQTPESEMRARTDLRSIAKQAIYDLVPSTNFSGLLFLMFVYGLCASRVRNKLKFLPQLTESFSELSVLVIKLITIVSPFGIFSSMIMNVMRLPVWSTVWPVLDYYLTAIFLGILIQFLIVIPLFHYISTGRLHFKLLFNTLEISILSLCVPTGLHTVPITMTYLQNTLVDNRIVTLVIPFGAGYHRPSTAVFYALAPIFLIQASGKDMEFVDVLNICGISLLCTFGESGFPGASTTFVQNTAQYIGADPSAMSLILPVNDAITLICTMCNVLSDCICARAVHEYTYQELQNYDRMKMRGRKQIRTSLASVIRSQ